MVSPLPRPPRPPRTRDELGPGRLTWTIAAVAAVVAQAANLGDVVVRGQQSTALVSPSIVVFWCVALALGFGVVATDHVVGLLVRIENVIDIVGGPEQRRSRTGAGA